MKRRIAMLLVVIMTLSLLTGCQGGESKESNAAQESNPADEQVAVEKVEGNTETTFGLKPFEERQNLRIGLFAGSQTSIPFSVAIGEGFFEELNIDVEVATFTQGPAMMEANADWDISTAGVAGTLVGAIGYDLPAVGICDRETNQVLFVNPASEIAADPSNPEVYKGTTWLLPLGTTAHYALIKQLEAVGLTMNDVNAVNMDVSSAYTAFCGGEGDGTVLWSNFVFDMEDAGYTRIADSGSLDAMNSASITMTKEAIENKHDLMVTAWALFYMTVDWCNANEENMKLAAKYYLETCEEEGIACTEDSAMRTYNIWKCPGLSESLEAMTAELDDPQGIFTDRKILQAEKEILTTMDFFVEQEKYRPEDRERLLEERLVDNSIALDAKAMLDELGIGY